MGYHIRMIDQKFFIPADLRPQVFEALKSLGNGSNDERAHAGSWSGGKRDGRWFSWMNDVDPNQWPGIQDAFADWRYPVEIDETGNVVGIEFSGEKIGQENIMFETIAKFVSPGSFIRMMGEDGYRWKWVFDGKTCQERKS